MAFLLPALGALGGKLFEKFVHFEKGGQVKLNGKNKASGGLAVLHDGEMVVPKKQASKVKKLMKQKGMKVPVVKKVKTVNSMTKQGKKK